jgi:hypothetical protein
MQASNITCHFKVISNLQLQVASATNIYNTRLQPALVIRVGNPHF